MLSQMLSLPENWDYTLAGLSYINRESIDAIRIAGDDYPAEFVKAKFMKLNSSHIQFVCDCMRENTTKIRNNEIKADDLLLKYQMRKMILQPIVEICTLDGVKKFILKGSIINGSLTPAPGV